MNRTELVLLAFIFTSMAFNAAALLYIWKQDEANRRRLGRIESSMRMLFDGMRQLHERGGR